MIKAAHRGVIVAVATAKLRYASRDRRSLMRQEEPRTLLERWMTHSQHGGRSCHGMRPDAPPGLRRDVHGQLVISAQTNPANSRAMATTATAGDLPALVIRRNLPHSRC